jgi:hypothetical protein
MARLRISCGGRGSQRPAIRVCGVVRQHGGAQKRHAALTILSTYTRARDRSNSYSPRHSSASYAREHSTPWQTTVLLDAEPAARTGCGALLARGIRTSGLVLASRRADFSAALMRAGSVPKIGARSFALNEKSRKPVVDREPTRGPAPPTIEAGARGPSPSAELRGRPPTGGGRAKAACAFAYARSPKK